MINKSLGLIETYGYVPAVEAADACLKAANIEMIGLELVGGGLVTIKICGDVSAVKASIDAGVAAAKELGKVIAVDVIARLGTGLEKIIYPDENNIKTKACQQDVEEKENKESLVIRKETSIQDRTIDFNGKILSAENTRLLDDIRVVDLRKIARQIEDFPIERMKIKYAKKDELISAIKNYLKKKGD